MATCYRHIRGFMLKIKQGTVNMRLLILALFFLGNLSTPIFGNCHTLSSVSPRTLHCMRRAADVKHQFGDSIKNMHILEIGGGDGRLCKVFADSLGFASYTIIDEATLLEEGKQYLEKFQISNVAFIDTGHAYQLPVYDLVINNSPMCISPSELILSSKYGLLTLDFSLQEIDTDVMLKILYASGKKGSIKGVRPFMSREHQTVVWRPKEAPEPSYVKPKVVMKKPYGKAQNAVSYDLSHGRFGDNLLSYFHAKWFARVHGLPFLFKKFPESECLALNEMDEPLLEFLPFFKKRLFLGNKDQITSVKGQTLVIVPYFPNVLFEIPLERQGLYFEVCWKDPVFRKELVECLTPTVPVKTLSLPTGHLTVALHVRRGGEFESYSQLAKEFPLKMPPDSYYIDQLRRIVKLFPDQQIYVYIFTDAENPEIIAENYAKILENPRITFDWDRTGQNGILHDFFSMGHFDCMIRSTSNFSMIASKLGNYIVEIQPSHAYIQDDEIVIDEVEIEFAS